MLYLLNKDVRTVRWNGEPLHEATSAIVKETMNSDFTLTVKYPISDSGIYQLIQEDMLIKAPTPVLGAQLFRIKKPVEHNDHLEITAYHISDDVMQRSITPVSVTGQSCGMALSRMVQNTKTALGDFSFNSDIQDRRTFNTTETETLYSVLLDGKHSIVGTWEGELVRDNFAMTIKKSRGENRGVVITTHKSLKDYQRTKNSQNVVTRIHAKSTFKPEGAEKETTIRVTVDSPLINSYPYINEKEYENNNAKSAEELQKWAQAKFSNEGIDKVSDAVKIEAYELDGQVVHMGDTVNLKSWKHNVDAFKKAIAYEFDALKEEYISLTFDDKAGVGGSRASGGLSSAADAILGVTESAQEIALEKALQNADLDFDHQAGLLRQEISDGIELAKARAEQVKQELSDTIDQRFNSFNNGPLQEAKRRAEEALRNAGASSLLAQEAKRIGLDSIAKLEEFKRQATSAQTALSGDLDALKRTVANDIRPKQAQAEAEIAKQVEALIQTKNELAGVKSAQATYEETTTRRLSELANLANGKASKSELTQTADELKSRIASVQVGGTNLYALSKNKDILRSSHLTDLKFDISSGEISFKATGLDPYFGEATVHPKSVSDRNGVRIPVIFGKAIYVTVSNPIFIKNYISYFDEHGNTVKSYKFYKSSSFVIFPKELEGANFITMRFGCGGSDFEIGSVIKTKIKVEYGTIPTDWSPAPEDIEGQISAVESNFKQRADSLDAGVSRLTEGLRTKADISALNVTAENIRQSVKSLETYTQNKLDQKLNQAEFEVRAGSIQQEILNVSKDKADKTLVVAEAGKLREEFSNLRVGGRNYYRDSEKIQTKTRFFAFPLHPYLTQENIGETWTLSFDLKINEGGEIRPLHFYHYQTNRFGIKASGDITPSKKWQRFTFTGPVIFPNDDPRYARGEMALYDKAGDNNYSVRRIKFERGTVATPWSPALEDADEAIRTVQSQLAGSWAVQNLTSAGSIVSQINATNNQILIEAKKIRLKGKTLLDELTAIQGYFKRLFVGEGTFATLNTDILRANSITADKLVMDMAMARRFVSSDIFTDTLAAKEAFINKLRSVVVTATLLEGYKGRIGGFQIGTHEKDSSVYWITGENQFSVGMSNGTGQWSQTALWVNWGNNWGYPGDYAWYVKNNGKMYCYNTAEFWNTPIIHGNLRVTGHIFYNNENSGKSGYWIHSSKYSNFEPSNNYLYLYYSGSGYDWIPMNKEISDRRYKSNIEASTVSGLDVVKNLKTYSYRKKYDGKIEDIACGIMAQDVQKYAPEAFFENPDGAYSYNTFVLVPYLIKAIQELNQKIEKMEKIA